MTEYSALEDNIQNLLNEKKFDEILKILKLPENDTLVSENVWNIVNSVCLTVKINSLLKNEDDVHSCSRILLMLVEKGNPKEVLLSLLEQADSFKDNEFFCLLLQPLKITLKKTPGKRGKSLQWVLSTLNAHIETLKLPDDLDLQNEEKLLLDTDPAVQDTIYVLSKYLDFIKIFVEEVSFENTKTREIHYYDRIYNQQEIMQRYVLKLFYRPLLYHDLTVIDGKPKSSIQVICESLVKCLSKICHNVFNLFEYDVAVNKTDSDEDNSISVSSFSNLSYLIFVEKMTVAFQPFVYSHQFIFLNHLKYINPLLKFTENLVLFKGLQLANTLINQLADLQLNYDCMELCGFVEFPKLLLGVAIHSQIEEHRKSAIRIFSNFSRKLSYESQYYLIMQVVCTVKHSSAKGFVISLYKNNLHRALNGCDLCEMYLGKNLVALLKKICVLSKGVETDLLEEIEKIMAVLNLLRYLFIRDSKSENRTGVWHLADYVSKHFLKPLTTAVDMSRAHYKEAIKEQKVERKGKSFVNNSVTVNGEVLPNIPLCMEEDVLKKALTSFDVIESIMFRVKELLEA